MSRAHPFALALVLGLALVAGGCSADPVDLTNPWGLPGATPSTDTPPVPTPAPVTVTPPTTPPPPTRVPPKPPPPKPTPPAKKPKYSAAGTQRHTGGAGVALTFDDGPDPVHTPQLLDLLRHHRVKATFCVVGKRAREYPNLIRRIVADGHTLCNHSWNHEFHVGTWPLHKMRQNLTDTNAAIRAAVPQAIIKYFRAPGGNFAPTLNEVAKSMGMTPLYWSVDTRDWDHGTYGRGAQMVRHITYVVQHHCRPGGIILAHDLGKPDTITAFRTLLPWLKARYKLIPLAV